MILHIEHPKNAMRKLLGITNDLCLEENLGRTLINCSNIFFYSSPRIMEIKTKRNKWDLLKLKSFFTAKETNKMKDNP